MNTNEKISISKNKPCECTFCSQFYFVRIKKYNHNKKLIKYKQNSLENKNLEQLDKSELDKSELDNKINDENKVYNNVLENVNFTLEDLDAITFLKSVDCDSNEISKKTNLSFSIVEYVLKIINWKK